MNSGMVIWPVYDPAADLVTEAVLLVVSRMYLIPSTSTVSAREDRMAPMRIRKRVSFFNIVLSYWFRWSGLFANQFAAADVDVAGDRVGYTNALKVIYGFGLPVGVGNSHVYAGAG